jgi:hypothetical protein
MRAGFEDARRETRELRTEMHAELTSIRRDMVHASMGMIGALLAICATLVVHTLS